MNQIEVPDPLGVGGGAAAVAIAASNAWPRPLRLSRRYRRAPAAIATTSFRSVRRRLRTWRLPRWRLGWLPRWLVWRAPAGMVPGGPGAVPVVVNDSLRGLARGCSHSRVADQDRARAVRYHREHSLARATLWCAGGYQGMWLPLSVDCLGVGEAFIGVSWRPGWGA
jgi:hypothetical protein